MRRFLLLCLCAATSACAGREPDEWVVPEVSVVDSSPDQDLERNQGPGEVWGGPEQDDQPTAAVAGPDARSSMSSLAIEPTTPIADPEAGATLTYGVPLRQSSSNFRIHSDLQLDFDWLMEACEGTRARLMSWMEVAEVDSADSVDVFLIGDGERLAEIETMMRSNSASNPPFRASQTGGGYFHRQRVILLHVTKRRQANLAWFVSHEVCHSVLRVHTQSLPTVVNEGLAELIPQWALFAPEQESPEGLAYPYGSYAARCAQLFEAGDVRPLDEFVIMNFREFQSNREDHFPLAWSLLRTLMTSEHEQVAGRLPQLLRQFGSGPSSWGEFDAVYDGELVQRLWRADLADLAR